MEIKYVFECLDVCLHVCVYLEEKLEGRKGELGRIKQQMTV